MAFPGQLVQVMADVLGVSRATVVQYDRVLAENGLRSKHGRGTSAARVTPGDVANLLIAVGASYPLGLSAKHAAEICKKFSSMVSIGPAPAQSDASKLGLERLAALPEGHSFGDALTALIECAGTPEFSKLDYGSVWVQFLGPVPAGQIVVDHLFGNYRDRRTLKRLRSGKVVEPGLTHASSVHTSTIRALGILVSGEPGQK